MRHRLLGDRIYSELTILGILFQQLTDAIGDQGLKPTAKGNLPRNLCRKAALGDLIRNYKGRLILSHDYRRFPAGDGMTATYPNLRLI